MMFSCGTCGVQHDTDDVSFSADVPLQWNQLEPEDKAKSLLAGEQCVIEAGEEKSYFIRACLDIPIQGGEHTFTWGVWCSLSEENYAEVSESWYDVDRVKLGPYFGWLCTQLPEYADTGFLKALLHQRAPGLRPLVELEPTDHPLAVDQRDGIPMDRMAEIATQLWHGTAAMPE